MGKRLFFVSLALAMGSDVSAFYGCNYLLENISIWKLVAGATLQIVAAVFLFRDLTRSSAKRVEVIPSDYSRYGLLKTRWYYFSMILFCGMMLFAGGLNHPSLSGAFHPAESWWSCPKN